MPVDKNVGIRCDQVVVPIVFHSKKAYPEKLRRVKFFDAEHGGGESYLGVLKRHLLIPECLSIKLFAIPEQIIGPFHWAIELGYKGSLYKGIFTVLAMSI